MSVYKLLILIVSPKSILFEVLWYKQHKSEFSVYNLFLAFYETEICVMTNDKGGVGKVTGDRWAGCAGDNHCSKTVPSQWVQNASGPQADMAPQDPHCVSHPRDVHIFPGHPTMGGSTVWLNVSLWTLLTEVMWTEISVLSYLRAVEIPGMDSTQIPASRLSQSPTWTLGPDHTLTKPHHKSSILHKGSSLSS